MRPIILLALALGMAPALAAQTEPTDTIKIIDNAESVVITRQNNSTTIKAFMRDSENTPSMKIYTYKVTVEERSDTNTCEEFSENIFSSLPFIADKHKKRAATHPGRKFRPKRNVTAMRNIYWGWNFAYDGKAGIRNCFEAGVADVIAVEWKPWRQGPEFRIGAGFGFKRFRTADNLVFTKEGDRLAFREADNEATDIKSHWDVWTFHVPLMMSQRICNKFGVAFGTMLNFNTYSKAQTQMEINGTRYRETFKGLQQRLFTAELVGIIGFRGIIGCYAKWSPMPVMNTCFGPEFKNWTLGVSLNF